MTNKTLPAYLRLPDGLRLAGTSSIDKDGVLIFAPKQAMNQIPPSGLPVDLMVAVITDDDNEQLSISGSIDIVNARQIGIIPDQPLPAVLVESLGTAGEAGSAGPVFPEGPLGRMQSDGLETLGKAMRRFLIDLGDHLFDLSTSSRYGAAGRHIHYDALNQLKRSSAEVSHRFREHLIESLQKTVRDHNDSNVADLEHTSARSLDLVGLDEIDQKLTADKIVSKLVEQFRVELESLTIRAALLNNLDPNKARTPFHPAHVLRAFLSSLDGISDDVDVIRDITKFFGEKFPTELKSLYSGLNKSLIAADVEPGLEEQIRESGSLLNPPEKRIVKSRSAERETDDAHEGDASADRDQDHDRGHGREDEAPGSQGRANVDSGGRGADQRGESHAAAEVPDSQGENTAGSAPARQGAASAADGQPRSKHDAIYDAVIAALDSQHDRAAPTARSAAAGPHGTTGGSAGAEAGLEGGAIAGGQAVDATGEPAAAAAQAGPEHTIGQEEIAETLRQLQAQHADGTSLGDLAPLRNLLSAAAGADGEPVELDRDSTNRLNFIDNVFRTLHTSFDVSEDMEPSIARLRMPLARLSLKEPRFFTQPEHPAHQLLDKLSTLASADHTVNRNVQKKVAEIVERVAESYDGDSSVFDDAQEELDGLLGQQDRSLDRNVQRVISALEGQEKLGRAQRRVEKLVASTVQQDATPDAVQDLLDSGWRSALVQLALREGDDSIAWREESALLEKLVEDINRSTDGELPDPEKREMQVRLRALSKRLAEFNPGSSEHENALSKANAVLEGRTHAKVEPYRPPEDLKEPPAPEKVEQLPRLKRWVQRTAELEPGAKLRYVDKQGRRRQMELVFVSEDKNRFAFVNERGQKIAEMTAVQLARQLSRGATPPTSVDRMSVLDQSVYNTLEHAQRTLSFERNRDQLTRLINGDALMGQLTRTLSHAQRRGAEHAFSLLDIDNFGLVNDVFDETSGDEVLAEFAKLLSQLNDRRALTARMVEDEFGILLTYRSTAEAREIGEKIRKDIASSSLNVGGEPVSFTVSMGVAPVEQTTDSTETVVAHARAALELAKSQGRDQVVVYNPDQQEIIDYKRDREASRQRLEEAMSTDRLVLRAQPIVQTAMDGSASATHHYEILLSLRDDDGKLLSPQEFITSAERFGFINMVDRWVVREVFTWISSLVDKQKVVPELSINLSGTSITDNDFLDYILEQISEFGVGTSRLCFEITETGAIDNLPRAADFVRTLKNLGCKFSLDDFGTGLASHNYLRELPVDYVKIDGTFISNIHNSDTDFAMAKSINDLAHFLGQQTVAECVESLDNIPALREIGVDFLQGWGIGMPARLTEITEDLPALET